MQFDVTPAERVCRFTYILSTLRRRPHHLPKPPQRQRIILIIPKHIKRNVSPLIPFHKPLDSFKRSTPDAIRQFRVTRTWSNVPRRHFESHLPGCPVFGVQGQFLSRGHCCAVEEGHVQDAEDVLLVETAGRVALLGEFDCDICVWHAVAEWIWHWWLRPSIFCVTYVISGPPVRLTRQMQGP